MLAKSEFAHNRPTAETAASLRDALIFQRASQTYLWAIPLLNTMGMRDGFNESFGTGYDIMAIWERRLDARTHITTPNSDLIYGMTFVNVAETGPLVFTDYYSISPGMVSMTPGKGAFYMIAFKDAAGGSSGFSPTEANAPRDCARRSRRSTS